MLDGSQAQAVADLFDLGEAAALTGPVAAGRLGDIWRLATDRGEFAVKDARFPVDPAEVERDAAYQDVVRRSGVPMPAVVRTPGGEALAALPSGPVRVYAWVDVLGTDRGLDPGTIGTVVAHVHRVRVPATGPVDRWYVDPVGEPAWRDLVGRLRVAGAPFAERLEVLVPDLLAVEALLVETPAVQLCHRDLWADNVRRTPAGDLVVLDWENAGPGDPAGELALVMFEFGLGDAGRMGAVHAAYVEAGGPARLRARADLTMLVAQTGHIAQIGCERWLAATTDEDRADNAGWVTELLDEPVTVATVEAILDAAR